MIGRTIHQVAHRWRKETRPDRQLAKTEARVNNGLPVETPFFPRRSGEPVRERGISCSSGVLSVEHLGDDELAPLLTPGSCSTITILLSRFGLVLEVEFRIPQGEEARQTLGLHQARIT